MKRLSVIVMALPLFNLYGMSNSPWFIAQVSNESENLFLMSGHNQNQLLQSDYLTPEHKVNFRVADDQPVKIATPSGIYEIYIHYYHDKNGLPLDTYAVFQKVRAGKVSNKIGPILMFRSFFRIKPSDERLNFSLLPTETLTLLTEKEPIPEDLALQRPAEAFIPPFES